MKISNFLFDSKLAQSGQFQINRVCGFRPAQLLIILIILISVVLILTTSMFTRLAAFIKFGDRSAINDQATTLADGGVDYVIYKLNSTGGAYSGNPTLDIYDGSVVFGQIQIALTGSGNSRTVTSTGCVPNCSSPRTKRTVKTQVTITTTDYNFPYAVHGTQTGSTNTAITLGSVTGNVYSNSKISCSAGSVTGAVAYVNTSIPPTPACGNPTTQTSTTVPADIKILNELQLWKNAAQASPQVIPPGCSFNCILSNSGTSYTTYQIGPAYIPGNLELGDYTRLALTGPVYIGGYLKITAASSFPEININSSLGACGTVIVVGGQVNLGDSISFVKGTSFTTPKGYPLIITESTNSFVANPAIKLISGSIGPTTSSYLEAIFYAPYGLITNGSLAPIIYGAVVGNKVSLSPGSTTYGSNGGQTNLQPAKFCGLGNVWTVQRGSYKISK